MNELGLKNKDLVGKMGSKGYVSSLLNKKKPLTLELAKLFHQELNIQLRCYCPSDSLKSQIATSSIGGIS